MATCKVSIHFVAKQAAKMILDIDQKRATGVNHLIDCAMQDRHWFSRKPVHATHTQAMETLREELALEMLEVVHESQRQHCLHLLCLCQAALTSGDGGEFIDINEEDISMLGFNQQGDLQQAFNEFAEIFKKL